MKKNLVLLYGGKSGEHEVSLISGASILRHLDREAYHIIPVGIARSGEWFLQDESLCALAGQSAADVMQGLPPILGGIKVAAVPGEGLCTIRADGSAAKLDCDVVFPALHGTFGEDGTVQGLLECCGLPYVGSGVLGSAIGMDKHIAKELWTREGLPVVDSIPVRNADMDTANFFPALIRKIEGRFGWPCFVKPACSGSSVGTSKAGDSSELEASLRLALRYGEMALVERFVHAREVECAVLGNDSPLAFPLGEIVPAHEFYDYEAKYKDPEGAALVVPAQLSQALADQIRSLALKAYRACKLSGMARVDFFIDKRTGEVLLNEVNTIPGFTAISMYPRMCQAGGLAYAKLLDRLVELALERHDTLARLEYRYIGG
jgi:D-alanine-D-alanine ligase